MSITLKDLTPQTEPNATPIADSLKSDIAAALARVPDGKTGAVVAYITQDTDKVQAVLTVKAGDHWAIAAHAEAHDVNSLRHASYGVAVQYTW